MSDEGRILNDIANKKALAEEARKSQEASVREEARRAEQEAKNLQAELRSRHRGHNR